MQQITSLEQVDNVFREGCALLFKHSTKCPISASAYEEVEIFFDFSRKILHQTVRVSNSV